MSRLEEHGLHCFSCSGVCCTFVANSMMTTPTETLDLLSYLASEQRLNEDLIKTLETTIRRYRLDQPSPGDGKRVFSRRTYTCPFFAGGQLGCTLSREAKPYGCLGFNAKKPDQTEGGDCAPNTNLLEQRQEQFETSEAASDQDLKSLLDINWDKKPMPVALLEFLHRIGLD